MDIFSIGIGIFTYSSNIGVLVLHLGNSNHEIVTEHTLKKVTTNKDQEHILCGIENTIEEEWMVNAR